MKNTSKPPKKAILIWRLSYYSFAIDFDPTKALKRQAEEDGFEIVKEYGSYCLNNDSEMQLLTTEALAFLKLNPEVTRVYSPPFDFLFWASKEGLEVIRSLFPEIIEIPYEHDCQTELPGMENLSDEALQKHRLINARKSFETLQYRLSQGFYTGPAPFGYKHGQIGPDKTLLPDLKKERIVKRIFRLRTEENKSSLEISQLLSSGSLKVTQKLVSEILQNPTYASILTHKLLKKPAKGNWMRLVETETFIKAHKSNLRFSSFNYPNQ